MLTRRLREVDLIGCNHFTGLAEPLMEREAKRVETGLLHGRDDLVGERQHARSLRADLTELQPPLLHLHAVTQQIPLEHDGVAADKVVLVPDTHADP